MALWILNEFLFESPILIQNSKCLSGQKRHVQWTNIAKFAAGFLDWWTDVLFCLVIYDAWLKEDKNIFFFLFGAATSLLFVSWINQLVRKMKDKISAA